MEKKRIKKSGWILLGVLLCIFYWVSPIFLLLKESYPVCSKCGLILMERGCSDDDPDSVINQIRISENEKKRIQDREKVIKRYAIPNLVMGVLNAVFFISLAIGSTMTLVLMMGLSTILMSSDTVELLALLFLVIVVSFTLSSLMAFHIKAAFTLYDVHSKRKPYISLLIALFTSLSALGPIVYFFLFIGINGDTLFPMIIFSAIEIAAVLIISISIIGLIGHSDAFEESEWSKSESKNKLEDEILPKNIYDFTTLEKY